MGGEKMKTAFSYLMDSSNIFFFNWGLIPRNNIKCYFPNAV